MLTVGVVDWAFIRRGVCLSTYAWPRTAGWEPAPAADMSDRHPGSAPERVSDIHSRCPASRRTAIPRRSRPVSDLVTTYGFISESHRAVVSRPRFSGVSSVTPRAAALDASPYQ